MKYPRCGWVSLVEIDSDVKAIRNSFSCGWIMDDWKGVVIQHATFRQRFGTVRGQLVLFVHIAPDIRVFDPDCFVLQPFDVKSISVTSNPQ